MKREELIQLKELIEEEKKRREDIQKLQLKQDVMDYLALLGKEGVELDPNDIIDIVKSIFSDFKVTNTNGIYVCTDAHSVDSQVTYEGTEFYSLRQPINAKNVVRRFYKNIEDDKYVKASKDKHDIACGLYVDMNQFESTNTVLNPYNDQLHENGFDEVRANFVSSAISKDQTEAKRRLLSMYERL
jgi:hypothetical protein